MSDRSIDELIQACGFDKESLPGRLYTLGPDGEVFHGQGAKELTGFVLSHLGYLPLDDLRIHEEVIGPAKKNLSEKILKDGRFTWPVLVSGGLKAEIEEGISRGKYGTGEFEDGIIDISGMETAMEKGLCIVLDGTHRHVSLMELRRQDVELEIDPPGDEGGVITVDLGNLRKIPVLGFDYHREFVELCPWCRVTPASALEAVGTTVDGLVEKGVLVRLDRTDLEKAMPGGLQEKNPVPLVAFQGTWFTFSEYAGYLTDPSGRLPPIKRDYELSKEHLEVDASGSREGTLYHGFERAAGRLEDPGQIVVFPRKVSKPDVIKIAWEDQVFPRKTTRHVFPFRIYDLPISLSMLCEEGAFWMILRGRLLEMGGATETNFTFYISAKKIFIKEGNTDRYYTEHMFKFELEE